MERPDESLIKDADLRRELERHRHRTGGANGMFHLEVRILIEKQEERDAERAKRAAELADMPREKRRRLIVREVFENAPPTPADLRHIHSVLAICGLPYDRQPIEQRDYFRQQGNMSIEVMAGHHRSENGEKILHPLPFGPKARLILMHLCSEAIRQKSPTIEIADTFTAFVRDMGFADNGGRGGALTAFREQLNALANCSIRITSHAADRVKSKQFFPIEEMDVWLSRDPSQPSLWPSTVTFSPTMFESLQKHALPVNARAVKAFAGSARKLDLYFWLGWRMNNIETPLHISWKAIAEQFGQGFKRERDFRAAFKEEIDHLKEVFAKLPIKLTTEGLTLHPVTPDVLALPVPKSTKKK
jgi:hypothetical protein